MARREPRGHSRARLRAAVDGMTVSLLGDGIYLVALAWQVYELSDTPERAGARRPRLVRGAGPVLLLAGVLSDRLDRRRVMIGADLLRAVAAPCIGALALSARSRSGCSSRSCSSTASARPSSRPAFSALVPDILAPAADPAGQRARADRAPGGAQLRSARRSAASWSRSSARGRRSSSTPATFLFIALASWRCARGPAPCAERAGEPCAELREASPTCAPRPGCGPRCWPPRRAILFFMGPMQVLLPYVVKNRLLRDRAATARSSRSRAWARSRCRSGSARVGCRAATSAG